MRARSPSGSLRRLRPIFRRPTAAAMCIPPVCRRCPATAISITGRTSGPPRQSVLRAADHELPDALSDLVTEALAAHDGRAAAKYEHVVAASRATHLLDMVDVDEAGAVDLQHRLRAQRLLGVEERAARVEGVLADRQLHVVAVGGHELD